MIFLGEFQQYDYGKNNEDHYGPGIKTPPNYDLSKVTVSVALFYGQNDLLASEKVKYWFKNILTTFTLVFF